MAQPIELMQSATAKALSIPEIISLIMDAICCEPRWQHCRILRSCALVQSSWEIEARRRLWEYCVSNMFGMPPHVPKLDDLLGLKPSRQQDFANNIRCISIRFGQERDHSRSSEDLILFQLQHLSFPRLEEISLYCQEGNDFGNQQISLKQLIGSRLRKVSITAPLASPHLFISEEWITSLTKHSRHIQEFSFLGDEGGDFVLSPSFLTSNVSPATLVSFLESNYSLTSLQWKMGGSLSKTVFKTLAQMPLLRILEIPKIPDPWISDVNAFQPEDCFRSLEKLDCEMSAEVLAKVLPSLRALKQLYLQVEVSSTSRNSTEQTVKTLARVIPVTLEELRLSPTLNATVNAADVLEIARTASNLRCLDMARHHHKLEMECHIPKMLGLDDDFVRDLALLLPKLETICLVSSETKTSESCLIHLGRHCPLLLECILTARIGFEELWMELNSADMRWPRLTYLSIHNFDIRNLGDESNGEISMELNVDLPGYCRAVLDAMPCLEAVVMPSEALEEFMVDVLTGEDNEPDEETSDSDGDCASEDEIQYEDDYDYDDDDDDSDSFDDWDEADWQLALYVLNQQSNGSAGVTGLGTLCEGI
ncbi:MAG: hypothetical protein GOMPHAMPRED_006533 [Gomphillus americanus]|uniref:Uncharacterized protein n=1 Tax=Gomphillus americanus TaxID=1940652 RepID=A0A8H3G361_9LECA|nr:MAG: hypothetical protein GOMPHAMPRED_006533 [Gomphillus americanus]